MNPERERLKTRARLMAGSSRDALVSFLKKSGLNDADAFGLAVEIQHESVARIRRAGLNQIVFGAAFAVGAFIFTDFHHPPNLQRGFVILIGLAGLGLVMGGLSKIAVRYDEYVLTSAQDNPEADPTAAGNLGQKIPTFWGYVILLGCVGLIVGVAWKIMYPD